MKKQYIILLLTLCTVNVFSQTKDEKIENLKIAYFTEKLDLSKSEAQKFWPIYNDYNEQNDAIREEMKAQRRNIDIQTLTEAEAKILLTNMIRSNDERELLFNLYIKELQNALPAKKIIILKKTEDEFKRKIFDEYKKRHRSDNK
ncbi:sensor of ECF-type sigma factor [Formosa sp. PL04]|uniref:sensor of ECF-type sigma factor n=1 Tax=Formosa sp. PL04 TaxID=3081755 RepID=UPI0029828B0E|nr:sensor of ECF-type sigma factor [Formosa sp. PL04]MDW5290045.1 sensor of ECF-type sigma factor [Formosa sp. PL04]